MRPQPVALLVAIGLGALVCCLLVWGVLLSDQNADEARPEGETTTTVRHVVGFDVDSIPSEVVEEIAQSTTTVRDRPSGLYVIESALPPMHWAVDCVGSACTIVRTTFSGSETCHGEFDGDRLRYGCPVLDECPDLMSGGGGELIGDRLSVGESGPGVVEGCEPAGEWFDGYWMEPTTLTASEYLATVDAGPPDYTAVAPVEGLVRIGLNGVGEVEWGSDIATVVDLLEPTLGEATVDEICEAPSVSRVQFDQLTVLVHPEDGFYSFQTYSPDLVADAAVAVGQPQASLEQGTYRVRYTFQPERDIYTWLAVSVDDDWSGPSLNGEVSGLGADEVLTSSISGRMDAEQRTYCPA